MESEDIVIVDSLILHIIWFRQLKKKHVTNLAVCFPFVTYSQLESKQTGAEWIWACKLSLDKISASY